MGWSVAFAGEGVSTVTAGQAPARVGVDVWNGHEIRLLRRALRRSIRDFAEYLGVNMRTVSKWESAGMRARLRPDTHSLLDAALRRATGEEMARFARLRAEGLVGTEEFGEAARSGGAVGLVGADGPTVRPSVPIPAEIIDELSVIVDFALCFLVTGWENADMYRRELLRALGAVGAAGTLGDPVEVARLGLAGALDRPLGDRDLDDWDAAVDVHARDVGVVLPGVRFARVVDDVREVALLLRDGSLQGAPRSRMVRVAAQLSILTANTLVALGQPRDALRWWRTGRRGAEDAGDADLEAFVLGRHAVASLYGGYSPAESVALADRALAVGRDRPCSGTASALSARAQALAVLHREEEARVALEELDHLLEGLPDDIVGPDSSWFAHPEHKVLHTTSYVHSFAGREADAERARDRLLPLYPAGHCGHAQVNLHRSACLLREGDVTAGVTHAVSTLDVLSAEARANRFVREIGVHVLAELPDDVPEREREAVHHVRELLALPA